MKASSLIYWFILIYLLTPLSAVAVECNGPYKGKQPTPEQLKKVLEDHKAWLEKEEKSDDDPLKANLCLADLRYADLWKANLSNVDLRSAILAHANLEGAKLSNADLRSAILGAANLTNANLMKANLMEAYMEGANLTEAYLNGANLRGAYLYFANMTKANLDSANLTEVHLHTTELKEANLRGANLSGANLNGRNLRGQNLMYADLTKANMSGVNLTNAKLVRANLTGADLVKANLTGADLTFTNIKDSFFGFVTLTDAIYAPVSAPSPGFLGGIKGLKTVTFEKGRQSGLVLLRGALKNVGQRELERQATYVIEKHKTQYAPWYERWMKRMLFEYPSDYGLYPGRPLWIITGLFIICAVIYTIPIYKTTENYKTTETGIIRAWPFHRNESEHEIVAVEGEEEIERLSSNKILVALGYGLYFSLLSTFHIGWRELNMGNWIARMQPRRYVLRAEGWVRTVSGVQSLISVYMLALSILTYFGRPFE